MGFISLLYSWKWGNKCVGSLGTPPPSIIFWCLVATGRADAVPKEAEVLTGMPLHPNVLPPPRLSFAPAASAMAAGGQQAFMVYPLYDCDAFMLAEDGAVPEPLAASVMAQLLLALRHVHAHGVSHCDVKLENLLCRWPMGPEGPGTVAGHVAAGHVPRVVLADFGLCELGSTVPQRKGSPHYLPPESEVTTVTPRGALAYMPYDGPKADAWAAGQCAAFLLTQMGYGTWHGALVAPDAALLARLSPEAQDFLRCAMVLEPAARPGVVDLLTHPWLADAVKAEHDRIKMDLQASICTEPGTPRAGAGGSDDDAKHV